MEPEITGYHEPAGWDGPDACMIPVDALVNSREASMAQLNVDFPERYLVDTVLGHMPTGMASDGIPRISLVAVSENVFRSWHLDTREACQLGLEYSVEAGNSVVRYS